MSGASPLTINDAVKKIRIANICWFHAQLPPKISPATGRQASISNALRIAPDYLLCLNASYADLVKQKTVSNYAKRISITIFTLSTACLLLEISL